MPEIKNFRHVWSRLRGSLHEVADIRLEAFITQHCLPQPYCVASIGIPSEHEFLALNSLVDPSASFVLLASEPSDQSRAKVKELTDLAVQGGFESRTQIADLTLPGRWAQLLPALAIKNVGVLRIEARWALKEPSFWENLRSFVTATGSVVCIRGALDCTRADLSLGFLRSVPAKCPVDLIASTRTSLWFAPAGDAARLLRETLRSSGIAEPAALEPDTADPCAFVENTWVADWPDRDGRVPLTIFNVNNPHQLGIDYVTGWSSPESDGRWTDGDVAMVKVTPPAGAPTARRIAIMGNAWIPRSDDPCQIIRVGIGHEPAKWVEQRFEEGDGIKTVYLDVKKSDTIDNSITLHVKVQKPGRPADFGEPDFRVLGFKFRALAVFT